MKYLLSLIFILNLCVLAVHAQLPPPPPLIYKAPEKTELKEFVSEDKTFQITFPGIPKISKQEIEGGNLTSYIVYRQGSNSIVNTADFTVEVEANKEKIYETMKSNLLKLPKTTIEAERNFKIDGKEGKEFDVVQDFYLQKIRILIIGKRIYEIKSDVTNWHILSKYSKEKAAEFENETRRFFDSFKHIKLPEIVAMPAPVDFLGESSETGYKNTFFGFSLNFPAKWHRADEDEIEAGKNMGLGLLKTNKVKIDKAFEEAVGKEVVIFAVSDRESVNSKGTNLAIGVLKQPGSQVTAEMVADASKNFFLSNPKFKLVEDLRKIEFNGAEFSTFTIKSDFNGVIINQKIFITIRKGYSVNFVFSYNNTAGLKSLEKIFETVKFDKK